MKFALRSLARSPGFAAVAIATLALGIGLNTAMFSFVNTLLLRPLPYDAADELVRIHRTSPQGNYGSVSPADFLDLQQAEDGFVQAAAFEVTSLTIDDYRRPVQWLRASVDLFDVLGVQPQLGRAFRADENLPGWHRVVVISHALWQDRFGGASDVLGQTLRSDGQPYEIIGVLPAAATDHRLFGRAALFSPLSLGEDQRADRESHRLTVLARRDSRLSRAQGDAFITAFGARLAADHPAANAGSGWRAEGLPRSTVSPTGQAVVFMLLGLSGCVLAITCSNLANLLLARAMERTRELAVRSALGASRFQLIRPLLLEAALLVGAGGAGALLVATWTTDWLDAVIQDGGGPAFGYPLDWRVLGFTAGVSALTLIFFALAPALYTGRIDTNDTLKSGARGPTASRSHRRFRSLLVSGQFASALMLLAAAGYFLRGADNLLQRNHGWAADRVTQANVLLPGERYPGSTAITDFQRRLIERVAHLPGVEAASISYGLPYLGLRGNDRFLPEGRAATDAGQEPWTKLNGVSPDYFHVTGTRLISGRTFTDADTITSPQVAIINETMTRNFFGGENALGRRIARTGGGTREWLEIVGVVADVQSIDVAQAPARYQLYQPATQDPRHAFVLAVRAAAHAPAFPAESLRLAVAELDPTLSLQDVMPVEQAMAQITSQMDLCRQLLAAFAGLGLLLATLGVYGVITRLIVQRTGEIGIRMALGAQVPDVIRLVLGYGARIALLGAAAGSLGSIGFARLLASFLPAMETNGALVLATVSGLLGLTVLVACWLPARRAAQVDPVVALRAE